MILASFYAPRPEHGRHTYDFIDCLRLQRASCDRFGVRQMVITDASDLGGLDLMQARLPRDLMPAIIEGQRQMLDWRCGQDIILTGADCLLGRDPANLFDGTFDIAVTTHPFSDCILNTGLIAVAAKAAPAAAKLWAKALDLCGTRWGDDQLSLAKVFEPTLDHGDYMRHGLRVKFLPCKSFNWAPEHENDDAGMPLIVHFRGQRKKWMRAWAERFAA